MPSWALLSAMHWLSGPHWYCDLAELRREFGEWITTDPKPGRYHSGRKAGQLSQAGIILTLMLRSLVEHSEYSEVDFCRRLDEELFPFVDGTPIDGWAGRLHQPINSGNMVAACGAEIAMGSNRRSCG